MVAENRKWKPRVSHTQSRPHNFMSSYTSDNSYQERIRVARGALFTFRRLEKCIAQVVRVRKSTELSRLQDFDTELDISNFKLY